MTPAERLTVYEAIEQLRSRPVIIYATSHRSNANGYMASDAVREFIDQIDAIPREQRAIDILLHSTGGDALTAWKLMSVLRERFDTVSVLVPYMAFSAATIFALGADEIVMHPHASLGPIDPQITVKGEQGQRMKFGYEDVNAFVQFMSQDVKLTEQAFVAEMAKKLFDTANPLLIGAAKRASSLSETVGERMLALHMKGEDGTKGRAREIARNLNRGFFAHGDAVSRTRARDLGLKVAESNLELERLVWRAYEGIEELMQTRTPFEPLALYLEHPDAALHLKSAPMLAIPPNTPPDAINALWKNWINHSLQKIINGTGLEVDFSNTIAVVESLRMASEFRVSGMVYAQRDASGAVAVTTTIRSTNWARVKLA